MTCVVTTHVTKLQLAKCNMQLEKKMADCLLECIRLNTCLQISERVWSDIYYLQVLWFINLQAENLFTVTRVSGQFF